MRRLAVFFPNPAAIALGMVGVLGGIRVFFDPASSPVALEMPRLIALAWGCLYSIGGAFVVYGVLSRKGKFEASGWMAFGAGALTQALATISLLDTNAFLSWYSIIVLVVFAICAIVKAYLLRAGYRLIWFKAPDTEEVADG